MARLIKAELHRRQKLEAKNRQVSYSSLSSHKNNDANLALPHCSGRTGAAADYRFEKATSSTFINIILSLFCIKNVGLPMPNYVSRQLCSCGSSTALGKMRRRHCDPFLLPYAALFVGRSTIKTARMCSDGSISCKSVSASAVSASACAGAASSALTLAIAPTDGRISHDGIRVSTIAGATSSTGTRSKVCSRVSGKGISASTPGATSSALTLAIACTNGRILHDGISVSTIADATSSTGTRSKG